MAITREGLSDFNGLILGLPLAFFGAFGSITFFGPLSPLPLPLGFFCGSPYFSVLSFLTDFFGGFSAYFYLYLSANISIRLRNPSTAFLLFLELIGTSVNKLSTLFIAPDLGFIG